MARQFSKATQAIFRREARRLSAAARAIDAELGKPGSGLRKIGDEIMTDVKASRPGAGVPRDLGTLARSGRVDGPVSVGNRPVVTLSFGDDSAPYALVQHERTDFRHTMGESRYLVRGMERWQPNGSAALEALRANAKAGIDRARR